MWTEFKMHDVFLYSRTKKQNYEWELFLYINLHSERIIQEVNRIMQHYVMQVFGEYLQIQ